ncbi:prolipoprotein diacylglyceryl transferase [Paraprevotella xylaniphila]|uniref:prolipoprotein diacylglyceryl transferase n=1 Tax=Paraprevotella xylaniphila TaxID=454155 RepID=UPI0024A8C3DE|nr:prolipoprotein diacylglyceryl transferase [Paraprevotella xylaniphila]
MTAMDSLLFITWNPDLFAFHLGSFGVRWYSLCWCFALLAAYVLVQRLYRRQHIADKLFDPLFFYCFVGILVGARLGHCLFYEPDYFLAHPLEMILPMQQTANGWVFTGYAGLASHGGTIGLMLALWLYVRKTKLNIMRVLDNIAIATPASAMFIRLGNLMNSEIIGKPTDVPWAFVFERVDMLPRHPGQLYEAICYFVFLIVGYVLYHKYPQKVGTGFFFGFCLTTIFTARFFIEYTKEVQEAWEASMLINMGQILSIPFILLGIYCMAGGKFCKKLAEKH